MVTPTWISDSGMVTLYKGDCLKILPHLKPVETCITDPPYGLSFMSKEWDHGVPGIPYWKALQLLPGGMLLAFGGTRTYHRLVCAIEDVGYEIRDQLMWLFGAGFPKSLNISKAIDKAAGAERKIVGRSRWKSGIADGNAGSQSRETDHAWAMGKSVAAYYDITAPATEVAKCWDGWHTALKPAWSPIVVAMKPLDGTFANNAIKYGVAGLWIDGGKIGTERLPAQTRGKSDPQWRTCVEGGITSERQGRWPANVILSHHPDCKCVVRQEEHGCADVGSIEIVEKWKCHPDCMVRLLDEQTGILTSGKPCGVKKTDNDEIYHKHPSRIGRPITGYGDSGGASRFFYCAKASKAERGQGNKHPTVKPVALMEYLCRLTRTPTGGTVIDPFMGSGSTLIAAILEGRPCIGIEINDEYFEIAKKRIQQVLKEPDKWRPSKKPTTQNKTKNHQSGELQNEGLWDLLRHSE